jgi:hypothetical protein
LRYNQERAAGVNLTFIQGIEQLYLRAAEVGDGLAGTYPYLASWHHPPLENEKFDFFNFIKVQVKTNLTNDRWSIIKHSYGERK